MAALITCQNISKGFSGRNLFTDLSVSVEENDKLAILGPNGVGKSTLVKIFADLEEIDEGRVVNRRLIKKSYLAQTTDFDLNLTVREAFMAHAEKIKLDPETRELEVARQISQLGLFDGSQKCSTFSGGWLKRISISLALLQKPDVLLLDEPTNHLDLEGILWLQDILKQATFSWVLISHDRYFINQTAKRFFEINPIFASGYFASEGDYEGFQSKKIVQLESERSEMQSLANKVRREDEWLQRGPKARTTKAQARIDKAHDLKERLSQTQRRLRSDKTEIEFSETESKSKKLITVKELSKGFGEKDIIKGLNLALMNGDRLGLLGANGSGKSTILKLIAKEIEADRGKVEYRRDLQVVYFDQQRDQLHGDWTLKRALSDTGDSVIYRDKPVHVVTWAKRFQFKPDQLDQKVAQLSGGEQARVLIARLMLKPADVLLLDEPTNDLDIDTLEVLEESLINFNGAVVLISHDRYLVDKICTDLIALDGKGAHQHFTGYRQWENHFKKTELKKQKSDTPASKKTEKKSSKQKKLSYKDQREYDMMEAKILEWEEKLDDCQKKVEDPEIATKSEELRQAYNDLETAQKTLDELYGRWAELEEIKSQI